MDQLVVLWRIYELGWINSLRALAALAVIMIHIAGPVLYQNIFSSTWWIGHGLDTLSRFAVPLFLMISGALLLHKEESIVQFAKKRASSILIPFLAWSILYYLYANGFEGSTLVFIKTLVSEGTSYHLWYFYMIIPLYFMVPLLRKIVSHIPLSYIWYYAIISGTIVTAASLLEWMGGSLKIYVNPFSPGVALLLLGYALTHRNMKIRHINLIGMISVGVVFVGTYLLVEHDNAFNGIFYDALGIFVMLQTVMIFNFLNINKEIFNKIGKSKVIRIISTHSFGIYLLHPLVINILSPYFPQDLFTQQYGYTGFVIMFLSVLGVSIMLVWILSQIPLIKKIV